MGVLGRGLASLIPKRAKGEAQDALDHIDEMEFEQDAPKKASPVVPKKAADPSRRLSIMEDFEQIEQQEQVPMPDKPLVTPLPFDPFATSTNEETVAQAPKKSVPVSEETDDDDVVVSQPEPEVPALHIEEEKEEEIVKEEAPQEELEVPEEIKVEPEEAVDEPEEEELPPAKKEVAQAQEKDEFSDIKLPAFGDGSSGGRWDQHEQQVEHVAIGDIKINPLQPRRTFDPQELEELMNSIDQHGILQPLVVHRLPNGEGFELIAGERRLRASKKLGWEKVPVVIRRDVSSDQSRLVFALIENIQRQNLNPIEEASAYKQLNEEYGLTHEEIGVRVGKSRVAVTNIVRILQLPAEIQRGLTEGKITTGHAKAILMIPDAEKQIRFYQHLLDEGLTVRKAEVRARRIQRTMNIKDPLRRRNTGKHPLAIKYSPSLEERYGFDAQLKYVEDQNKFEVVFRAHSESEVEELVGRLLGMRPLQLDVDKDVIEE